MVNIDSDVVEYFSMHNVIYKRSLLKNMDYIQTEGISYTDQEWIFYPMLKADSAVFFNLSLYRYTLGREGQTMDWGTLCRNIGMIENIVMQMLIRLTDYKNDISVCRRKYVEYLQPIITQYFIDNKSEIWLLFLIAHSKR